LIPVAVRQYSEDGREVPGYPGDQHRAPGHQGPDAHPVQLPGQDRGHSAVPQPQGRQHQHPVQGLLRQVHGRQRAPHLPPHD